MLNAYEDWYTRRNWYALYISIVTGKGSGTALKEMGTYKKNEPGHYEVYKSSRTRAKKYSDEQIDRALKLRDSGMTWREVADEVGMPYGSLMTICSRLKRKAVSND